MAALSGGGRSDSEGAEGEVVGGVAQEAPRGGDFDFYDGEGHNGDGGGGSGDGGPPVKGELGECVATAAVKIDKALPSWAKSPPGPPWRARLLCLETTSAWRRS